MTLFEYIAIAFSLVFSFTVLRLVGGLPYAIRPGRVYWTHLAFVLTSLIYVLNAFWAFWSYRDVDWTYARYLVVLASPAAHYFVASILVPPEPGDVASWREYYFENRLRLFAGLLVIATTGAVSTTILAAMPLDHPARLGQAVTVLVGVVGVLTADPRVNAMLATVSFLGVAAFGVIVLAQPGGLG